MGQRQPFVERWKDERSSVESRTYATMAQILSNDFPTLVPPYFCTTHGTFSSVEFRNRFSRSSIPEAAAEPVGVEPEGESIWAI